MCNVYFQKSDTYSLYQSTLEFQMPRQMFHRHEYSKNAIKIVFLETPYYSTSATV